MPKTRPIQYEPKSSDERTEHALFKKRIKKRAPVPAARTVSNGLGALLAGSGVRGSARLKGGNPGPVGTPIAGSTDGSPVTATFD